MQAITISTNGWTDAGHAVNQVYDMLYMMGRDDIAVGVGGEGGILPNGTILPDVGGYLPIIDQVNINFSFPLLLALFCKSRIICRLVKRLHNYRLLEILSVLTIQ